MVCLIHLLQQLVNSFIDLDKKSLPSRPEHKTGHLVKSGRGIVNQKSIFRLISCIDWCTSFRIFTLGCLSLRSNQIKSFRDKANCFTKRVQHIFTFFAVCMSCISNHLRLHQKSSNIELVRCLHSLKEKPHHLGSPRKTLRDLYRKIFTYTAISEKRMMTSRE